jgi:membrane complex biogenesis BtpA family protein
MKTAQESLPFLRRFEKGKVLLGMVHLAPLPGSPFHLGESIEEIIARARRDAEAVLEGGMDGFIIENFGDVPFFAGPVPPHVLTHMTRIALELAAPAGALRGVNVLRNDAMGALAIAAAAGLDFIRVNVHTGAMVTDQGIIEGRAAETLRARALLRSPVAIAADVLVKHAAPLGGGPLADPAALALDLVERGGADALIVTGPATGAPVDPERMAVIRRAAPGRPLLLGSGATPETLGKLLASADGAIIGTSLKLGGDPRAPVDARRVRALVKSARGG